MNRVGWLCLGAFIVVDLFLLWRVYHPGEVPGIGFSENAPSTYRKGEVEEKTTWTIERIAALYRNQKRESKYKNIATTTTDTLSPRMPVVTECERDPGSFQCDYEQVMESLGDPDLGLRRGEIIEGETLNTYQNAFWGVQFDYPSAWKLVQYSPSGTGALFDLVLGGLITEASGHTYVTFGVSPARSWEKENMAENIVWNYPKRIGGVDWYFRNTVHQHIGVPVQIYALDQGAYWLTFTFVTGIQQPPTYQNEFGALLNSFEFIPQRRTWPVREEGTPPTYPNIHIPKYTASYCENAADPWECEWQRVTRDFGEPILADIPQATFAYDSSQEYQSINIALLDPDKVDRKVEYSDEGHIAVRDPDGKVMAFDNFVISLSEAYTSIDDLSYGMGYPYVHGHAKTGRYQVLVIPRGNDVQGSVFSLRVRIQDQEYLLVEDYVIGDPERPILFEFYMEPAG